MSPHRTLVAALALAACGRIADDGSADGDESGTSETGQGTEAESNTESESTTESGSGSEEVDSDDTDTSDSGPVDSDGPPTPEDFEALCLEQTDRAGCEAVPDEQYEFRGIGTWCAWFVEVPVEMNGETCTFGEPDARCVMEVAGEVGCEGGILCGAPNQAGWSRVEGDGLIIGRGDACFAPDEGCAVDAEGTVISGVAECACLCDPGFPL